MIKYTSKNPLLSITPLDTESVIIQKIFIEHSDDLVPLSGFKISKQTKDIYYETVLDVLRKKNLLKNFNEYINLGTTLNNQLFEEIFFFLK